MKNTTKIVKDPRMNHEAIYQLSTDTIYLMTQDFERFTEYGVSKQEFEDFKKMSSDFNQRAFDEKYVLRLKFSTDAKKKSGIQLLRTIYKLQSLINLEWADLFLDFKLFDLGSMSKDSDLELFAKAKALHSVLRNSTELISNTAILDVLQTAVEDFGEKINNQKVAGYERKIATKLRQSKAINLFANIRKYRELGKRIWLLEGDTVRSESYLMP